MNRDFYFTYINEKIELLSLRIKSSGKLNILNLNIHAEFFYRDLCCLLFELNLENQNTLDQNSEAIDLIDDVNKIIIQVSSTDSKQKINDTLAKNKILDYKKQGYNLKFLFFSDAKRLKTQKFNNKYDINFDASRDIIGKEDIFSKILMSQIDKQHAVYQFIKAELGDKPDENKISSNLADLINLLADEDLNNLSEEKLKLHEFNIDRKIVFNHLQKVQGIIKLYSIYCLKITRIYSEFDKQGKNKSLSVFNKLSLFYAEESLNDGINENQIFLKIISKTVEYIRESENYRVLPAEELEQCVSIIVVDSFLRCNIFENPEGYEHVIAQ